MSDTPGSLLVAEIGSHTTRVTLIDVVEGESRMIGRAEVPSSIEPPHQNALVAVLEATAHIEDMIGRRLLHDGQLLMPQNKERDGIDHVVSITSAAGDLALVVTAIASDVSARSALHACRGIYTSVLQVITLDDAMMRTTGNGNESWIVRQIQSMLSLEPDAILIAGGLEDGAVDALARLAHIVGLTALRTSTDATGQQRQNVTARPVIFAGNSAARERVLAALSDRAEMIVVDNVRPTLEYERLEPARQALNRLYDERVLPRLPGLAALRRLSNAPVSTVCDATGLMTRFVAERNRRQVLTLDIGSASSSAFLASENDYTLAVLSDCGTGYGLTTILKERGVAQISRWLPFAISDDDLLHHLLNKLLRPHLLPTSREELLIEQAVAREALALVRDTLVDERPQPVYNMVIAGGGVLAHVPYPGMAALILLDALQPLNDGDDWAIDLRLDTLGLLPVCGALSALNPDATVTVFDRDFERNMPLATCIVPVGEGTPGEVALEAELRTVGGGKQHVTVRHGQIVRLPLPQGARGHLTLSPADGVRIGNNEPGASVEPDTVAGIKGSALGIVIDARGRPLRLPAEATERSARIREWLAALGVDRDHDPAAALTPVSVDHDRDSTNGTSEGPIPGSLVEVDLLPTADQPERPEPEVDLLPTADQPEHPESEPEVFKEEVNKEIDAQPQAVVPPDSQRVKPGSRISLSDLAEQESHPPDVPPAPAESAESEPDAIQSDLARLRQTVEQPKKRGWFGRKPKS